VIEIKIRLSPTRFVKPVKSPAFKDLVLEKKITKKNEEIPKPSHPSIIQIRWGERIKLNIEPTKTSKIK